MRSDEELQAAIVAASVVPAGATTCTGGVVCFDHQPIIVALVSS